MRHEGEGIPADPEDARFEKSLAGIHTVAKLLGALKRELLEEGFDEDEALQLCEAWMIEAFPEIDGVDPEDE
jgi:hypothetical protein